MTARFLAAVGQELGEEGLTPAALARAAVQVLPFDAAGISTLVGDLRIPLGASTGDAVRAEALQTTLGEGPCLHAAETQASAVLDLDDLKDRWPHYTDELITRTPFRSVVAIPLRAPGSSVFAALELYSNAARLDSSLDMAEIDQQIAAPTAALLSTCLDDVGDLDDSRVTPEWYQTAAGRRHNAWVAIGIIMAHRPAGRKDVVSLLRAHAYAQDRSLDDVAADVVDGHLPPAELID